MDFHVVIPARYDSTRLPKKALLDIGGKPMIHHVYERAVESGAVSVVIATDDERIEEVAKKFGAKVCMTASTHRSGTDRVAEAVAAMEYDEEDIIVSLQADEPLLPSKVITDLAYDLAEHDHAKVATMASKITDPKDLLDQGVVKVVLNYRNFAIYFSRAPIPWDRDHFGDVIDEKKAADALKAHANMYHRHIGLYAFRADFLQAYTEWAASPVEKMELLEQLRILWRGYKIHVGITTQEVPPGVDTQADLDRVRNILSKK